MTTPLVQLTAEIVSSHALGSQMSSDDLIQEIGKVFTALKQLEAGDVSAEAGKVPAVPVISFKKAFRKDEVVCMICGKGGFKTLTRHLNIAHELKPGQYRKQFNIPSSQSLTATNYSESRRQAANENNLAANLEKARAVRAAKKAPATKVVMAETVPVVAVDKKKPVITARVEKAVKKPAKAKAPKK